MSEPILTRTVDDTIRIISFNRPESRNSLNPEMGRHFTEAVNAARYDPNIRVLILTGSGSNFSSGGHFKAFGAVDPEDPIAVAHHGHPNWNQPEQHAARLRRAFDHWADLHSMEKPTIAMARGPSVGAGMGVAAACDFRIVSDNASFHPGYLRVGLSTDVGTSYFVTKLLGPAKAREIYMLGEPIDAQESLRIGFVTRVVPDERLEEETIAFARKLVRQPPVALQYRKELLNAAETETLREILDMEAIRFARCFQTEDMKEAVRAFVEKREPQFKGR